MNNNFKFSIYNFQVMSNYLIFKTLITDPLKIIWKLKLDNWKFVR